MENHCKAQPAWAKEEKEILESLRIKENCGELVPLFIKEELKKLGSQIKSEQEEIELQQVKEEPDPLQIKAKQEEIKLHPMKEERAEPEPPQIKDEQEELSIALKKERLELKQLTDTCTVNTTYEERDLWEPDSNRELLLEISLEPENKDHEMGNDEELNQSERCQKTIHQDDNVNNPNTKRLTKTHMNDNLSSCKVCGKLFARSYLTEHMRIHTGERLFSCATCGKNFITGSKLKIHIRTHTGERPFSCLTCGKSFSDRGNLSKHMKTHSDERPFSCLTCGKGFTNKGNLFQHARTHTGEKPFSCLTCGKGFAQQIHLNDHMRVHTGEKPFSCTNCGKSFSERGNLFQHMRTHSSEKPFVCLTCGKSFTQQIHLSDHIKIHTGEKPFSCLSCGKSFRRSSHLTVHMKTHPDFPQCLNDQQFCNQERHSGLDQEKLRLQHMNKFQSEQESLVNIKYKREVEPEDNQNKVEGLGKKQNKMNKDPLASGTLHQPGERAA